MERIVLKKKYLLMPVRVTAMQYSVNIRIDGEIVYQCIAGLFTQDDPGKPNFYAEIPVNESWMNKELEIDPGMDKRVDFLQSDEMLPDDEPLRPYIHLTPKTGWVNDVCGACWYQGKYHLYFQHNMHGLTWQNMSWGHAVSEDLIHWEYAPEAIIPDADGPAFTGSAVIARDVPGVPDGSMVVYYTAAGGANVWSKGKTFFQKMLWSEDGYTFKEHPEGKLENILYENRDPKVYRYEKDGKGHWFMVLFLDGHEYGIYVSDDLLHWEQTQSIVTEQSWECPDLVELPVAGSDEKKWLFWTPNGFYLVGEFDGRCFTAIQEGQYFYGNLLAPYAAQTFSNTAERVIQVPFLMVHNQTFFRHRGMFGVPRTMELVKRGDGYDLAEHLVSEITDREKQVWTKKLDHENVTYTWEDDCAILIRMKVNDAEPIKADIAGSRMIWDPQKKSLCFSCVDANNTHEVDDITVLIDRGITEITINNDTVIYYQHGGAEIGKELTITGTMDITFSCIDTE